MSGEGIFFVGTKACCYKDNIFIYRDQIITSDPSQVLAIKKSKDELEAAERGVK